MMLNKFEIVTRSRSSRYLRYSFNYQFCVPLLNYRFVMQQAIATGYKAC